MDGSQAALRVLRAAWRRLALAFTRTEAVGLGAALPVYLVGHARYMVPRFGETDASRNALDALAWYLRGAVSFGNTSYRMRTSPLYIHALKCAMSLGVPIRNIPGLMNRASLIASAVGLLAAYLLYRRLTDRVTAALACSLLAFTPAYFVSGNYGMAQVPAVATLLLALLAFANAMDDGRSRRAFAVLAVTSAFLMFATLSLKADLVLTGLAFPGLAWLRRKRFVPYVVTGSAIVVAALAAQLLYVKAIVSPPPADVTPSLAVFAQNWHSRFPFDLHALQDHFVLGAITHSSGPFLFSIAVLSLLGHLFARERFRLGIWAAAAGVPTMLFWGLIFGNCARHNLASLPPLMLLVAATITRLVETPPRAMALGAGLLFFNYNSDRVGEAAGFGLIVPKTNLIEFAEDQIKRSAGMWTWAQKFADLDAPKKAVIAQYSLSYASFEVGAQSQGLGLVEYSYDGDFRIHRRVGGIQTVRSIYGKDRTDANDQARSLRESGYVVWLRDRAVGGH
jgi:hypothetical protein